MFQGNYFSLLCLSYGMITSLQNCDTKNIEDHYFQPSTEFQNKAKAFGLCGIDKVACTRHFPKIALCQRLYSQDCGVFFPIIVHIPQSHL